MIAQFMSVQAIDSAIATYGRYQVDYPELLDALTELRAARLECDRLGSRIDSDVAYRAATSRAQAAITEFQRLVVMRRSAYMQWRSEQCTQ